MRAYAYHNNGTFACDIAGDGKPGITVFSGTSGAAAKDAFRLADRLNAEIENGVNAFSVVPASIGDDMRFQTMFGSVEIGRATGNAKKQFKWVQETNDALYEPEAPVVTALRGPSPDLEERVAVGMVDRLADGIGEP